jgi:hypothetical protein
MDAKRPYIGATICVRGQDGGTSKAYIHGVVSLSERIPYRMGAIDVAVPVLPQRT